MESTSRTPFPYSKTVLNMPKGPERNSARARERARAYHLRTRKANNKPINNLTRRNSITPVAATPVAATPVAATPVAATPIVATPVAATPVAALMPTNVSFSEPIPLAPFIEKVRHNYPRSSARNQMVYGEACEVFAEKYLPCKQCNNKSWIKAKRGTPAYDLTCNICGTKYQIKGSKNHFIIEKRGKCEVKCARFNGVFECHKNYNLDYYLIEYPNKTHIEHIYYINHKNICADTNLYKTPVSKAIFCNLKLDKTHCEKIM